MTWNKQNVFCVPVHGTDLTVKAAEHEVVLPRGGELSQRMIAGINHVEDQILVLYSHLMSRNSLVLKGFLKNFTHSIDTLNLCIFNKYIIYHSVKGNASRKFVKENNNQISRVVVFSQNKQM